MGAQTELLCRRAWAGFYASQLLVGHVLAATSGCTQGCTTACCLNAPGCSACTLPLTNQLFQWDRHLLIRVDTFVERVYVPLHARASRTKELPSELAMKVC